MTDAPERIWGGVENLDAYMPTVWYRKEPCHGDDLLYGPFTEYLRADLCARNAILEEAAKVAERYSAAYAVPPPSDMDNDEAEYFLEGARDGATAVAAAIRAMKEAK